MLFPSHRVDRAMAETRRLNLPAPLPLPPLPRKRGRVERGWVTALRIVIVVATLLLWEAIARSGLLYRDVVPSLAAIGGAIWRLLAVPDFQGGTLSLPLI